MKSLSHDDSPVAVRILVASSGCVLALYAALTVAMRGDHPSAQTVMVTAGVAFIGFMVLSAAATSRLSRVPLYLTMALTTLVAIVVLAGLPWAPHSSSIGSQIALLAVLALIGATGACVEQHPRRALVLLVVLAVVGAVLASSAITLVRTTVLPPDARVPMWELATIIAALFAAVWHGRVLRGNQ